MRKFLVIDAEQRSPAWFAARLGCATASRADAIAAAPLKSGGEPAAKRDYRTQLVCEILTGQLQEDSYVDAVMQRAMELEPEAFAAYEAHTGRMVARVGFLRHTDLRAGCSPDGVIGDCEGLVELKCPKAATHARYIKAGTVPADYLPQLTHQLWVSGAPWVDFVSFDPRFPPRLQLMVARLERNEALIAAYEQKALAFLREVDDEVNALLTLADIKDQLIASVA